MPAIEPFLRYVNAARVDTPGGSLDDIDLVSPTDGTLGKLDGIMIDPVERQVRYFVVTSRRTLKAHQYLVPVTPARIDLERRTLQLELEPDELDRLPEVRSEALPPFSEEDLIEAMFSPRPA